MKRHILKCATDQNEKQHLISEMSNNRQHVKSKNAIDSWCCKMCDGYYQYPKSHLKKIHPHIQFTGRLWKNYYTTLPEQNENYQTDFEINLNSFCKDYLLNPKFSSLDLATNADANKSMKRYRNQARETLLFASRKENPTEEDIVKGTAYLCDAFPDYQFEKKFKAGNVKAKLTSFQHYLHFVDMKVRMDMSPVRVSDLSLAFKLVQNTIKSLKGRVKMRDSEVAVERSKFFWSVDNNTKWEKDPTTVKSETLLDNPYEVGKSKSNFVLARNHIQIKIAKENGKRNLELAMLEISQTIEPECVSSVNNIGELQYVIYNRQFKNKKAGGISKICLNKKLMTQLLDYISIIRPNFESTNSKNRVFITCRGDPVSAESMSKNWKVFQSFYDGHGSTTNQNFRQQFGRLANEYGNDSQRRHAMDQQDHSEATATRYYEQNPQVSIEAVGQNKYFHEEASKRDDINKIARKSQDGEKIKIKMAKIQKGSNNE